MADALDGGKVTEIFVGTQVILHVSDEDYEPDADDILAALKKHKQKAKGDLERDDDYIL